MTSLPSRILGLVLLASAICAGESAPAYSGSSTVYPIVVAAAEKYADTDPRFTLDAQPTGSSAGHRALLARESTVIGSSRPATSKELAAYGEAKIDLIEVPIAYDGIAVVTNPRNAFLKHLTVQELKSLWSKGGPTSWKQVRADFPDAPIKLYGPGKDSGTLDYFIEAIIGKDAKIRDDYVASEDDHVLVQGISSNVNAIGFFGVAYLEEAAGLIVPIAIDAGHGAHQPSKQAILDGDYQPLSRPIFLYFTTASIQRSSLASFTDWILDHPGLIDDVGYVPLPDAIRSTVRARLAARTTGSLFGGRITGLSLAQALGQLKPVAAAAAVAAPAAVAPAPAPVSAAPVATPPAPPAWQGPSAQQHVRDLDRMRAAALDLARRSLDDGSTVEDLARRAAEVDRLAAGLQDGFRTAPRTDSAKGLTLAEAGRLVR